MSAYLEKKSGFEYQLSFPGNPLRETRFPLKINWCLLLVALISVISDSCQEKVEPESVSESQALIWLDRAKHLSGEYSRADWEEGKTMASKAVEAFQEKGDVANIWLAQICLSDLCLLLQEPREALDVLQKAEGGSRKLSDQNKAALSLRMGQVHSQMERYPEAVEFLERGRLLFNKIGDRPGEVTVLQQLANNYWYAKKSDKIPDLLDRAVHLSQSLNNAEIMATTLFYQAVFQQRKGQSREAMETYRSILGVINLSGNRLIEAKILNNLGILYNSLGEPTKGLAGLEKAADLFERMGLSTQGACYMNMGQIYILLGERGQAFFYLEKARAVYADFQHRQARASVLYFLGNLYGETGDDNQAYSHFRQALDVFQEIGSANPRILVHLAMAEILLKRADSQKALDHLYKALGLASRINSQSMLSRISDGLGESCLLIKDYPEAICHFETALSLHQKLGLVNREATTLQNLSRVYLEMNRPREAESYCYQALALFQELGQRQGEAASLHSLARIQNLKGHPMLAMETNDVALDILESLRAKITGSNLRTFFSATIHELYDFKINLLVQLSKTRQDSMLAIRAFETAERARAQTLLELLQGVTPGDDPEIVHGFRKKKQELINDLNGKSLYRMRLIQRGQSVDQVDKEIDNLIVEYRRLEADIDQRNPRYAHLSGLNPAKIDQIQNNLLDRETALLEYALGNEASYLFLVTKTSFRVFPLPAYAELEKMAREAYEVLNARNRKLTFETNAERERRIVEADTSWVKLSRDLSDILIRPVLPFIQQKRLLVIAEDALQFLPFNALQNPIHEDWSPLVLEYEITTAPSAGVLLFLARERENAQSANRPLAIFADPVFGIDDPRFDARATDNSFPAQIIAMEKRESGFKRLAHATREAEKILELIPEGKVLQAIGFDATRAAVMDADLRDYRILHFATHGVMDARRPELSGLVFSLFDEQGTPKNGFLSQSEIFQLRLNADLVVLSACQTALGQEIKGEGMVGITQGFMYAGAPLVIASLWSIQDEATADFMSLFYKNMLQKGMAPAQALRETQRIMWRDTRWKSPYYWGPFIAWGLWEHGS